MVDLCESRISCGVNEIYGLQHPRGAIEDFLYSIYREVIEGNAPAFYIFSDKVSGNGKNIVETLLNMDCGTIYETDWKKNPNTGNYIKVWVWGINRAKFLRAMRRRASL